MKNPFTNTENYMIVQEFNRLSIKKRSNSSSSQSSFKSSHSSKMDEHYLTKKVIKPSLRYNQEYLVQKSRPNLYELQRKRALIFGIQQLRYKPSYLNKVDSHSIEVKSKQKEISSEKQINSDGLKTQKSIKKILKKNTLKQISYKDEEMDEVKQQQIQIPIKKKRSSVIEQMIQLNIKDDNKSNQFYASIVDLKSRHEMLKSNTNIKGLIPKKKKKCSIFHGEYEQFVQNQLTRSYKKNESQYEQSERSRWTDSRRLQQTQQQIDMLSQVPKYITIRNRIYYKYIKEPI